MNNSDTFLAIIEKTNRDVQEALARLGDLVQGLTLGADRAQEPAEVSDQCAEWSPNPALETALDEIYEMRDTASLRIKELTSAANDLHERHEDLLAAARAWRAVADLNPQAER